MIVVGPLVVVVGGLTVDPKLEGAPGLFTVDDEPLGAVVEFLLVGIDIGAVDSPKFLGFTASVS